MKRAIFLLLPLVLIAVFVLPTCFPKDYTHLEPLPYIKTKISLSKKQQVTTAKYIRQSLAALASGKQTPEVPMEIPVKEPTQVFLSLYPIDEPPLEARSETGSLRQCLRQAVDNMAAKDRFQGKHISGNTGDLRLRVEILRWRKKYEMPEDPIRAKVEAGWDGLILQKENELVYQEPWNILHEGWDVPDGAKRKARRLARQFERLSKQAGMGADGFQRAHIYRFRTDGFVQFKKDERPISLYRSNILLPYPIRESGVQAGLVKAGQWLRDHLDENGKFTYLYDPLRDKANHPWHYGVVRHAGAVYGLYALYNQTGDKRNLDAAMRAEKYLLSIARPPLFRSELLSIRQNGLSLLGASALGLLALCEKPEEVRSDADWQNMGKLAGFLLSMQLEDGAFYTFHLQALVGYRPSKQALYFPGEALLAMIRYAEELSVNKKTAPEELLPAINRAADFQIAEYERLGKPDNWTIQALARLHAMTGEKRYADSCLQMAKYLTDRQYGTGKKAKYRDYKGGFSNSTPPRATPAASRTEATSAAWDLARRISHPDEKVLAKSILDASWFMLSQQYRKENSYYLPAPEKAIGGIRGGLVDNMLRIDYNQHAIVAMLGAVRVLEAGKNSAQ